MGSFRFEYEEDGQRQTFSFQGESVSVGREQSQDFVLDHPTVSRQHAVVQDDGGGAFRLVVLSDGGLTAVDGERVQGETQLYDGSKINFGELQFRFRAEGAPERSAASSGGRGREQRGGGRGRPSESNRSGGGDGRRGGRGGPSSERGGRGDGAASDRGQRERGSEAPSGGAGGNGASDARPTGFDQESPFGESMEGEASSGRSEPGAGKSGGEHDETLGQALNGDAEPEAGDDIHIESWDEIAREAEEDDEEEQEQGGSSLADSLEPSRDRHRGSGEEEQTNPLLVVVAIAAIGGVIYLNFFSDTDDGLGGKGEGMLDESQPPVTLEVECLSPKACVEKAKEAYNVGTAKLNKKGAEISNLFNGYKKLLRAKKLMEKAEGKKKPPMMSDHEAKLKSARKELDQIFQNYQVQYFSAKKNQNYERMANALHTIKTYFPDKSAREHRWAKQRELEMKKKGNYPSRGY